MSFKGWKEVQLKDVVTKLGDGLHGTPKYDARGEYFFINGNNLVDGKIVIKENTKRVSTTEYLKYKKDLSDRTILLGINGTIGNVALYNNEKCILGKSACYFNVIPEVNKEFIKYTIIGNSFQSYIHNFASGTTIKNVSLQLIRDFTFNLPPKQIQDKVASILTSIDEKIELNRQTNQTLEAIAQALFKEWFVDFNFPGATGEMVESEVGMIPKGWRVGKLGEDGEFKNGINYSRDEKGDTKYSIINVRDVVENKFLSKSVLDDINVDAKKAKSYLVDEDDIIIVRSASPGETAIVFKKEDNIIYSGFTIRYRLNNKANFLYYFFIFQNLKAALDNLSNGTTLKNINQEMLKAFRVIVPPISTISKFNDVIKPIFEKLMATNEESKSITQLRDALLPKLMKGELITPLLNENDNGE